MEKAQKNLALKYFCILYFSIALIMMQASGLHMHVQHDDHASVVSEHTVDVHAALMLHEVNTFHGDSQDTHHQIASDISQDYLVKKSSQSNHLALIAFFIGIFLCVPRLFRLNNQWRYISPTLNSCYSLLQPPLRAPPLN